MSMSSQEHRRRLLAIIAEAADPYERFDGTYFEYLSEQDEEKLSARERDWVQAVTNGDRQAFFEIMSDRRISEEDFRRYLFDVAVRDAQNLPVWADALLQLAAAEELAGPAVETITVSELTGADMPGHLAEYADKPWMFQPVLSPFLHAASVHLAGQLGRLPLPVSHDAFQQLILPFARRLNMITGPVLNHEPDLGEIVGALDGMFAVSIFEAYFSDGDATMADWLEVFALYPVLARLIGVAYDQWRTVTDELSDRLAADLVNLETVFSDGSPLGGLSAVQADAGDAHRYGRTVCILAFDSGVTIVYKPKNLAIAGAFVDLVEALNGLGLPLALKTRQIVLREDYTWEEFVVPTPYENAAAVARFYFRFGMYARLIQMLGGYDFMSENVLATGEHPALVDLETFFFPNPQSHIRESEIESLLRQEMLRSVMATGMISAKIAADPGRRAAESSALDSSTVLDFPFRQPILIRDEETGSVRLGWDYVSSQRAPCIPVLNGDLVDPADYFAQVEQGYTAMDTSLRANAHWLAADDGPVASMAKMPVRYLHRSTHIYVRVLQQSLLPNNLRNGIRREMVIDRLWKGYARFPYALALFTDEVNAVRQLDSPLFQCLPGDTVAILNDGSIAADIFHKPALPGILQAIRELPAHIPDPDIDVVRSALFSVNSRPVAWSNDLTRPARPRQTATPDWLALASGIGDFISDQAFCTDDGDIAWYAASYSPWNDSWLLRTLIVSDLLSGAGGVAIVLAELARVSGGTRSIAMAQQVLRSTHRHLPKMEEQFVDYRRQLQAARKPVFFCGGYYGAGAYLYTLDRAGRAIGSEAAVEGAHAAVEMIRLPIVEVLSPADMVSGKSGLVMNLLALSRSVGGETGNGQFGKTSVVMAAALGEHLTTLKDDDGCYPSPPYPQGTWVFDALPGPQEGARLALARLDEFVVPANGREKTRLAPEIEPGDSVTSGRLLAVLAAVQYGAMDKTELSRLVLSYLDAATDGLPSTDILERLEVAITAFQILQDEVYFSIAERFANELVARYRHTGSWFPDLLLADRHNLSAVHGLGAIALAFVRIVSPEQVTSLRLLL